MNDPVTKWISVDARISEAFLELAVDQAMALGGSAVLEKESAFQVSYPDDPSGQATVTELMKYLTELDPQAEITKTIVERENWNREWQKFFKPVAISDRLVVLPEWEDPSDFDHDIITRIRPAMAFGTGTHETTQLCLKILEQAVHKDDTVLDLGTGSGILGITALHLGASHVDGVDIDPLTAENARENLELNGVVDKFDLQISETPDLSGKYDLMVINMVRARMFPVLPDHFQRVRQGGTIVLSGLLIEEEQNLRELLESSSWKIIDKLTLNEWIAFKCTVE